MTPVFENTPALARKLRRTRSSKSFRPDNPFSTFDYQQNRGHSSHRRWFRTIDAERFAGVSVLSEIRPTCWPGTAQRVGAGGESFPTDYKFEWQFYDNHSFFSNRNRSGRTLD